MLETLYDPWEISAHGYLANGGCSHNYLFGAHHPEACQIVPDLHTLAWVLDRRDLLSSVVSEILRLIGLNSPFCTVANARLCPAMKSAGSTRPLLAGGRPEQKRGWFLILICLVFCSYFSCRHCRQIHLLETRWDLY